VGCVHSGIRTNCEAVQHRADLLPQNYCLRKTDLDLYWWKAAESPGKITAVLPKLVISVAATYMRRHEDSFVFLLAERKMLDKAGGNLCRRFAWKQLGDLSMFKWSLTSPYHFSSPAKDGESVGRRTDKGMWLTHTALCLLGAQVSVSF